MNKNYTCQNLHGTLMWKDIPLIFVRMENGSILEFHPYTENINFFPFLLQHATTEERFKQEMVSRLFPPTRQHLQLTLSYLDLTEYVVDDIIAANYALNIDDCRWFKPHGSSLIYDDIKIRD